MCWTQCHLSQQHKSDLLKSPGGGIATFDFTVRMFDGARGKSLVGLLMISKVKGHKSSIPSVSPTSASRDSSSSNFPCVQIRDDSTKWADLI